MAYRLRYDRRFKRSLAALSGDIRGMARRMIAQLADDPHPPQAKELDDHPTYYRLWLPRQHRLVWQVLDPTLTAASTFEPVRQNRSD